MQGPRRRPNRTRTRVGVTAVILIALTVVAFAAIRSGTSPARTKPVAVQTGPLRAYTDACARSLRVSGWAPAAGAAAARSTCSDLGRYHPGGLSGLTRAEAADQGIKDAASLIQSSRP